MRLVVFIPPYALVENSFTLISSFQFVIEVSHLVPLIQDSDCDDFHG